jgi:hypothetical protein
VQSAISASMRLKTIRAKCHVAIAEHDLDHLGWVEWLRQTPGVGQDDD